MKARAVVPIEPDELEGKPKKFTTKLVHPTFIVEPCPNCDFPESDGGYCPECGYTRYRFDCPHCRTS